MSDDLGSSASAEPEKPRRRLTVGRMMLLVLAAGCLLGLAAAFVRAVHQVRETARHSQCLGHLKMIGIALLNYHEACGSFPPAVTLGPDGKPWHSWRMLILPYVESNTIYSQYRFDEPWDGPNNRKLHGMQPAVYACPDHRDQGRSTYVVVMGDGTAFPGPNQAIRLDQLGATGRKTIAVVESVTLGPHWMEPRDLELARMSPRVGDRSRPGLSSDHPAGVNVVFFDGHVKTLSRNMSPGELWSQLSIDGGGQDDRKGRVDPAGD